MKQNFNFPEFFFKRANIPALISHRCRLNYAEYGQLIQETMYLLHQWGIKYRDRVAVWQGQDERFSVLLIALVQIGAVAVPLNDRLSTDTILILLRRINCNYLIGPRDSHKLVEQGTVECFPLEEISLTVTNKKGEQQLSGIDLDQEATIVFTSGSSGQPKAVLHTLGNHYFSALGSNLNLSLTIGDHWLLSLPIYHVGGLAIIFRCILAGATQIIKQTNDSIADSLQQFNVTHVSLVSTQLYRLLFAKISLHTYKNLKAVLVGGSKIRKGLLEQAVQAGFPLYLSYGNTEMASQITTTGPGEALQHLTTSGKCLPYREIAISAEGEILTKGKTLCRGYVEEEKIMDVTNSEGWYQSGDQGFLDQNGYLTVTGRRDHMFISGGENIYPEEIENALNEIPEVEDAVVVDIPSAEYGARPVAFIKSAYSLPVYPDSIKLHLQTRLPNFKIPDYFLPWPAEISDQLKPDRSWLKKRAREEIE